MHNPHMTKAQSIIPVESIASRIYLIRGEKVMLDADLAELYGVTTGNLNLAVRRNPKRFPDDFVFQTRLGDQNTARDFIVLCYHRPMKVFISSLIAGMEPFRQAARTAIVTL